MTKFLTDTYMILLTKDEAETLVSLLEKADNNHLKDIRMKIVRAMMGVTAENA